MLQILEFLTSFYWLLLPQTLLEHLSRGHYRDAYQKSGGGGVVREGMRSLLGWNTYSIHVPIGRPSGRTIRRLLAEYGIEMWGWGFANGVFFFHVRRDDALLALDVLSYAGVEVLS